jgi:hypothetical protein
MTTAHFVCHCNVTFNTELSTEEHALKVGAEDDVCRKLHREGRHNLYSSRNIVRMNIPRSEMSRACSTHESGKKCTRYFIHKTLRKDYASEIYVSLEGPYLGGTSGRGVTTAPTTCIPTRSEGLTAVNTPMLTFWVVIPSEVV